jgi:hypothetical protein
MKAETASTTGLYAEELQSQPLRTDMVPACWCQPAIFYVGHLILTG